MKKLVIILIAAAVVLAGAGIALGVYFNSPEYVMSHSVAEAIKDFTKRDEIEPLMNTLKRGSLEFSIDDTDGECKYLGTSGFSSSGKLYFSDSAVMLKNFRVESDDLNEIDLDAYFGSSLSYIRNDEILGGTYGIVRGDMASAFANSIFAFGADSDVAVPSKEIHNLILNILKLYDDEKGMDDLKKDYERLSKKYIKEIWKATCKYGDIESEWDNVRVGGERISARVITLTLDGDMLEEIMTSVYEKACNDKKLYKFVEKISDKIGSIDGEELIDVFEEQFIDDESGAIKKALKELGRSREEYTVEVVTPKFSTRLLRLSVITELDEHETEFSVDVGKQGIKKADVIKISLNNAKIRYEIRKNNKEAYKSVLEVNGKDIFIIDVNKKRGKYTVGLPVSHITVSGKFKTSGKTITISVDRAKENDEIIFDGYADFILKQKDKMPKPLSRSDVTNVFDVDMNDVKDWVNNFGKCTGDDGLAVRLGLIKPSPIINTARGNLECAGYRVYVSTGNSISTNMYGGNVANLLYAEKDLYTGEKSCIRIIYYRSEADAQNAVENLREQFRSQGYYIELSKNMIYIGDAKAISASAGKYIFTELP